MSEITHETIDISQLPFRDRGNPDLADEFVIATGDVRCRILKFRKGQKIKHHNHDIGAVYKMLLKGSITYNEDRETLLPFQFSTVKENVEYDGEAKEESYLLLIEPVPSQIILTGK